MKKKLLKLLRKYAAKEGTMLQSGLRDALTDLRHIAEDQGLNFDLAIAGSEEVFEEEMAEDHPY